jgi:putative component of toxin-antitoxin plasmid stabilization module
MSEIEFQIEMYVSPTGRCPVAEFVTELETVDPRLAAALAVGVDRLRSRINHRHPLTAPLRDGILELRARGNAHGRILFSFEQDRLVLLLAGFVKSRSKVPNAEIEAALARREEWRRRMSGA